MKKWIIFGTAMIFLAGCTFHRAGMAGKAQTELLGMSKKDLLICAGVPVRQEEIDDMEFLTFSGGGDSALVAGRKMLRRYCEATFILKDGIVQKINYQGRTGGLLTKGEQCAFIVENCLKP